MWGRNSSHTRCVCMDKSGGPGQHATTPLPPPLVTRARCMSQPAGSQFEVKLVSRPQSPLPPLLSVHIITVSSLHRNANLAILFFRVPRSRVPAILKYLERGSAGTQNQKSAPISGNCIFKNR